MKTKDEPGFFTTIDYGVFLGAMIALAIVVAWGLIKDYFLPQPFGDNTFVLILVCWQAAAGIASFFIADYASKRKRFLEASGWTLLFVSFGVLVFAV